MVVFFKYLSIGFCNTLIHWSVFFLLFEFNFRQYFCNFIGFFFAVVFSYIANSEFTFNSNKSIRTFALFFFFMGFLNITIGFLADNLDLSPICTLIITTSLSIFLGYLFSRYFVFKEAK